tara:strand:- start:251 stop:2632 length:2382 start_codon:yes stop_codon:yes gene_type:complete
MIFSNKADTLANLNKLGLKNSVIPRFVSFSVKEWKNIKQKKNIIENIKQLNSKVCIRSSFAKEDSKTKSMAGVFDSEINIDNNQKNLEKKINKLIKSYSIFSNKENEVLDSKILIQNFVKNSEISGVITNKNLQDGTPYYVINYDDQSGYTNTVTSGNKSGGRVLYVYKNEKNNLRSRKFKRIIFSIKELEKKIGDYPMDIEFSLNKKNKFFIFQARPLSTYRKWKKIDQSIFKKNIYKNQKKFYKILNKHKNFGKIPSFGLMPDWNPVEMIGYQPDQLSYSLYEKLITDLAWSLARKEMNYKNINKKLMCSFSGKPYIDTRLSFFSYIPKNVSNIISKKIVNFWISELNKNPFLHDKVEFDIADSCFDINSKKKINSKYKFLNSNEKKSYFHELKKHTEILINNFESDLEKNKKLLYNLEIFRKNEINNFIKKKSNPILLANKLIKKLIYFGIVPFSKFARSAFIGKKFLNSMMNNKLIFSKEYSNLLVSINTVSNEYRKLKIKSIKNKSKLNQFNNYFYHLRPGTYDIKTNRTIPGIKSWKIDNFDNFFKINDQYKKIISLKKIRKIDSYLRIKKIKMSADDIFKFSLTSMKLRENSKFIFTRTLSDILELIRFWSKLNKIPLKNLTNLSFEEINKLSNLKNRKVINGKINKYSLKSKSNKIYNRYIKLPYLIMSPNDFCVASILITKPNFITGKIISAKIKVIKNPDKEINLKDKIVLIENADPGYDWVLSQKIKGLITKYGGVNSHMSIRCEELNKPAAIGIGDRNFEEISNSSNIILNCKEKKINIVN